MTNLQAQIILKNRAECMKRVAKLGERCGRCSICPLHTSLDDYIKAKVIANEKKNIPFDYEYDSTYEMLILGKVKDK